jgi:hypothetical protein
VRFGVNYTPSGHWFHSWLDFDERAIAADLAAIARLGADHVRIFPLWPHIQPNRALVRRSALDAVTRTVDLAGDVGLDVSVDGLQGHLSSYDFLPAWLSTWHRRNLFTDRDAVAGERAYLTALAEAVGERPNLLGITLGNEVNQFAGPPHPDPHPVTPAGAESWLRDLLDAARRGLGSRPPFGVTHAQYDASWYRDDQPFLPAHAAELGDATIVHSWVFNGAAALDGPLADASTRHAEYLLALAAAWHREPARPLWLQEVGAPTTVMREDEVPAFIERTIRHAVRVAGLAAVTWWCSHDVSRALADFPPVEYDLGLLDAAGRPKPAGEAFSALAAELRGAPSARPDPVAVELDDTDPAHRSACAPGGAFHRAWLAAAARGGSPQVLLRSRRTDASLLAARGIERIIPSPAPLPIP